MKRTRDASTLELATSRRLLIPPPLPILTLPLHVHAYGTFRRKQSTPAVWKAECRAWVGEEEVREVGGGEAEARGELQG